MAKPPVTPTFKDNIGYNYFDLLKIEVEPYFQGEGITLSFEGYKETIHSYSNLKNDNPGEAWELARELNMWSEYFGEISNLTQKLFLDSETDKISITSSVSIEKDGKNVSNGDRIANQDTNVVTARKRRNALKSFYTELEAKITFLERAYYHCKQTYEWNNQFKLNATK